MQILHEVFRELSTLNKPGAVTGFDDWVRSEVGSRNVSGRLIDPVQHPHEHSIDFPFMKSLF